MTTLLGAEHIKELTEEISNGSKNLSVVSDKLIKSIDNFNTSTSECANSQKKLQFWLCMFTFALVIISFIQCFFFVYQIVKS